MQPLTEPSPDAVETNRRGMLANYATVEWVETHDEADRLWFRTGRPSPMLNGILWARFDPDGLDDAIEHALAPFRERSVPMIWTVGPASRPRGLGVRLLAHGLTHLEEEPGMAIRLDELGDEPSLPEGVALRQVDEDAAAVAAAYAIAAEVFGIAEEVNAEFVAALAAMPADSRSAFRTFLATADGIPVATASMTLAGGVAGVYSVATVDRWRGRSIGTALTIRALKGAAGLGYRVGVLGASAIAYRMYERIGFREVCRSQLYLWSPAGAETT